MIMRARLILIILLLLPICVAARRSQTIDQLEIGLREGVAGLTYQSQLGKLNPGNNTGFDIAYRYNSSRIFGVRLGLSVDLSGSYFCNSAYADGYSTINAQGSPIDVAYTCDLRETHLQTFVSLPLQLGFFYDNWSVFVGPKAWLNLSANYRQSLRIADLQVTYPQYEVQIPEALVYAAGVRPNEVRGRITEPQRWWAGIAVEANYLFHVLYDKWGIGVGLYFDYAFNSHDLSATSNLSLLSITDTRVELPVHRVQESVLRANHHLTNQQVVQRYGFFDVGLKVSFILMRPTNRGCRICRLQHGW
ncbi:MAG: hypothetical protein MJZ89_01950 [Paludibacteraceae bacterium]|nr:hypothetical protein [Paludibacteraceae bacterium]